MCPGGSERESLRKGAGHADEENKPQQILTLLRQVEVDIANGKTTPQALPPGCRKAKRRSPVTNQFFLVGTAKPIEVWVL